MRIVIFSFLWISWCKHKNEDLGEDSDNEQPGRKIGETKGTTYPTRAQNFYKLLSFIAFSNLELVIYKSLLFNVYYKT